VQRRSSGRVRSVRGDEQDKPVDTGVGKRRSALAQLLAGERVDMPSAFMPYLQAAKRVPKHPSLFDV
jgi:hypothetical protein